MFTSPKFIAGLLGGVALGAAGSALYLFSDQEKSLKLRKKVATSIRNLAEEAIENIENLEQTAQEIADWVEGEASSPRSTRAGKKARTEEPAVN